MDTRIADLIMCVVLIFLSLACICLGLFNIFDARAVGMSSILTVGGLALFYASVKAIVEVTKKKK